MIRSYNSFNPEAFPILRYGWSLNVFGLLHISNSILNNKSNIIFAIWGYKYYKIQALVAKLTWSTTILTILLIDGR